MKLEIGKEYRTYGGERVKILYIAENPLIEIYKVIAVRGENEMPVTYTIDGRISADKDMYSKHNTNIKEEIK